MRQCFWLSLGIPPGYVGSNFGKTYCARGKGYTSCDLTMCYYQDCDSLSSLGGKKILKFILGSKEEVLRNSSWTMQNAAWKTFSLQGKLE